MAVTETTTRALDALQQHSPDPSQPLFGMTGETLANRIRAGA